MRELPIEVMKMIRVSVMYPNQDGATFDHDYYKVKHMEIVRRSMGDAVRRIEVDRGLAGGGDGAPAPYVAIGHLYFESMDALQGAMAKGGGEAMADLPNFTNVQPQMLISETTEA
jgi:uncharacterized protein (TIGR02118 family)